LRRLLVALLVGLVAASLAAPVASAAARGASVRTDPKVALIVGPVGGMTDDYRAMAREAAETARRYTPNVVEVYSPDATWPAVARAIEDASIVVYLGHGNGWPSRYRDSLYPITQNGFGLNPIAGIDDAAHQYFGEASLDQVRLAPNAVVLLHHLCYASGNTEPGLPEGTLSQAIQRVDNYAAGFIRAGASAVVAEGHSDPAWYVEQLLTSTTSVEQIWDTAPSSHGHEQTFASVRSPGYTARLDPDGGSSGFYRSLVTKGSVSAPAIRAGARATVQAAILPSLPSLTTLGLEFKTPLLNKLPVTGQIAELSLPVADGKSTLLPRDLRIGIRWDPLQLATVPTATTTSAQPATVGQLGGTIPGQQTTASQGQPAASQAPAPSPSQDLAPAQPPDVALVVPEAPGTVVDAVDARLTKTRIAVHVTFPATPGLYRLVPTLHAGDGVAYDAATQELLTPVLVRVGGPLSAAYGVIPDLTLSTGQSVQLPVRVANTGLLSWAMRSSPAIGDPTKLFVPDHQVTDEMRARLVGTWVSTLGAAVPEPVAAALSAGGTRGGRQEVVSLDITAPSHPGTYLLVLDVATPERGTLSAAGSPPAIVRVTVTAAPSVAPAPGPTAPPIMLGF
jgi:hypothetical protein